MHMTLFAREMRSSWKMLLLFITVLSMYIVIIISIYNPDTTDMLDQFSKSMPEVMAAFGMDAAAATLTGFISSYLYGMLLLVFPMVYIILRANGLIARYVDRGSMVTLLAAPVKRTRVAITQMGVLVTGITTMVVYITALEIMVAQLTFPGELDISGMLLVNFGLLCLHLFIGSVCFFASCFFSDTKYSIGFGAGVPIFMYILQMVANLGGAVESFRYVTFFSLFQTSDLLAGEATAITGILVLLVGAIGLFAASVLVFKRKDLHI